MTHFWYIERQHTRDEETVKKVELFADIDASKNPELSDKDMGGQAPPDFRPLRPLTEVCGLAYCQEHLAEVLAALQPQGAA